MQSLYDRVNSLLDYDHNTGLFYWKESRGRIKAGDIAGSIRSDGYRRIKIDGTDYYAHRLAWLIIHGYLPEQNVDHINQNAGNNSITNLRESSQICNIRNTSNFKHNTSGIKGVDYSKRDNKWRAQITFKYKTYSLGCYDDFDDAVCARLAAEQCLGWSGCDSSSPAFQYVYQPYNGNNSSRKSPQSALRWPNG